AEDGIRDFHVTGVQTCALPIFDASGKPVTPVLYWADTRSAKQVAALRAELDRREVHARTGCVIHSSYWPAKLRWLCETRPEQFRSEERRVGQECGSPGWPVRYE